MDIVVPGSVASRGGGFDALAVAVQPDLRVRPATIRTLAVNTSSEVMQGALASAHGRSL